VAADGTGSKGLYTSPLLRFIDAPDLPLETMLKHVSAAVTTVKPEPVVNATSKAQVPGVTWTAASCSDSHAYTAPAGSFKANAYGLHDNCYGARMLILTRRNQARHAAKHHRRQHLGQTTRSSAPQSAQTPPGWFIVALSLNSTEVI